MSGFLCNTRTFDITRTISSAYLSALIACIMVLHWSSCDNLATVGLKLTPPSLLLFLSPSPSLSLPLFLPPSLFLLLSFLPASTPSSPPSLPPKCRNLRLYKDYVEMYHRSLECLDRFKAESPNFRKFLDVRERDERGRGGVYRWEERGMGEER